VADIKQLIGNRVRVLRKEQGLSQEELGFKADLHHTYIGAVERGERNISLDSLQKIAHGLGVDVGKILNAVVSNEDVGQMRAYVAKELKRCKPQILKLVFDLLKSARDLEGQPSRKIRRKKV
jgi:transcriptional regulator with XRE-family HTH domain